MSEPPATCQEHVYDSGFRDMSGHVCGRKVKDEGLCGIHLAAKRRRAERNQAYDLERREQDRVEAETAAKVEKLQQIGINARAHYDSLSGKGFTGKVIVDPDQLLGRLR